MTNQEAKEILEWELSNFKYTDNEFVEATKVAIKALKKIDKIYPLLDPDIDQEIALDKIREVTYE